MYEIVKAVHLIAVVTFIAGMVAVALTLRGFGSRGSESSSIARIVLSFDRRVTVPALAIVWIAGFTLAADAGFLSSGWLLLKLVFVMALSGLHGMQGAALRKSVEGASPTIRSALCQPLLVLGLAACVILLVVIKPSLA